VPATARTPQVRHLVPHSRNRLRIKAAIMLAAFVVFCISSSMHTLFSAGPATGATVHAPAGTSNFVDQVKARHKLLGVAPDGIKRNLVPLNNFSRQIGRQPDVVEFYQGFTESFDAEVAAATAGTGALPLDSWGPAGAALADIASGRDDAHITSFARKVRDYGGQIALAVGHEMNAPWSAWWGKGTADAPTFVAAWHRIHSIFQQQGADNVIWVWTVNIEAGGAVWPGPYYPGDADVDWIGVDGYFHQGLPTSFNTLFGPTLARLRAHYTQPILVVETGALATPLRPAEIQSVFDAVLATPDLIGFVWFDYNLQSTEGVDWRLDGDKSSLAVYRRDATAPRFALRAPITADTAPFNPGSAS
jgi:hypothetical protein